jgi:hypothetical protein
MDINSGEHLGFALGRVLLPIGLLIWGVQKCQTLGHEPHANLAGFRGLSFSLGSWVLLLLHSVFSSILPAALSAVFLLGIVVLGLAGGALSVKGLAAWGRYRTGNSQAVVGLIVGVLIPGLIGYGFLSEYKATKEDVRSATFLNRVAANLNKQFPKKIDSETEITSVSALEGVFIYHSRLVNLASTEVNAAALANLKPLVTKAACANAASVDNFLKQGITLRYEYSDKGGRTLASFDVTRAECGV